MAEQQNENDEPSAQLTELELDDFWEEDCGEVEERKSRDGQGTNTNRDTGQLLTPTSNSLFNLPPADQE